MARVSIEDCLGHIENRFALVAVAADRARQLMNGKDPLLKTKNREAVTALREIAEELITGKDVSAEIRAAEPAIVEEAPVAVTTDAPVAVAEEAPAAEETSF